MKITDARVFVTCPGRNFVTLKISTDEGVYGLGDATLNGRELAVEAAHEVVHHHRQSAPAFEAADRAFGCGCG